MVNKDDGGSAFPFYHVYSGGGGSRESDGMSLRDYFAAHLLGSIFQGGDTDVYDETLARRCYEMADAMLEARKR